MKRGASAGIVGSMPSALPSEPVPPEASIAAAGLLSLSGGFLDAFTYVGHGQVFANAMTGNVVMMGVFLAAGQWAHALRHLPPLAAFFAGVFLARAVRRRVPHAAAACLGVEIVFLAAAAFLPPSFPDAALVVGISFVAALQNSGFTRLEGWTYNSVMTTGNLRRCAETLFEGMAVHGNPFAFREARVFGDDLRLLPRRGGPGRLRPRCRGGNGVLGIPAFLLGIVLLRVVFGLGLPRGGGSRLISPSS